MKPAKGGLPIFHPFAARCFESVFVPLRNFRLGGLHILNLPQSLPTDRPVVLIGNHISNWDGFIFREIQKRLLPEWPIYSVMLEAELRRHPFIRLLGGIGMDPHSVASVAGALRSVRALRLARPDFFLSYFPQGGIFPSFKRPLGFRAGIDLFIKALAPVTLIPVALHMEPMKKLAPTLIASLGRSMRVDNPASIHRIFEDLVQTEISRIQGLLTLDGGESVLPSDSRQATVTRK
jgi:1-acyl-sn-glycerol-3-phosphate acyltransferase